MAKKSITATCDSGHEVDLGAVPTDEGRVLWECPECGSRQLVPGTEENEPQPTPEDEDGTRSIRDGDSGGGKEKR